MDTLLSWLQSGLSGIGPFFILLGLLIFVHELGHFLVAKFYGVRVEVFSLGFGKKLIQYKYGDTEYCISMIPLGGYVKMYGDDPTAEVPEENQKHAFLHKPVGQRIAIVLAGPLMNFFFAAFLFAAVGLIGEQVQSNIVGDIVPQSAAYEAGFRSGDTITQVNGKTVSTWNEIKEVIENSANQTVNFMVEREGSRETESVSVAPELADSENILSTRDKVGKIEGLVTESQSTLVGVPGPDTPAAQAGLRPLDIILSIDGKEVNYWRELGPTLHSALEGDQLAELTVKTYEPEEEAPERKVTLRVHSDTLPSDSQALLQEVGLESPELYLLRVKGGSPADQAGLQPGDKIIGLQGQPIHQWDQVIKVVKTYEPDGAPVDFTVAREGEEKELRIAPEMTEIMNLQGQEENRFTVGIVSALVQTPAPPTLYKVDGVVGATALGFEKAVEWSKMVVMSIVRLLQAEVSTKNIGGVITIGRFASHSFEIGISAFMKMMAIISINLFLLNLLPVPVLDGGHLVFFTIEALRGAPLSMRKMEIAQQVGLILLMSLMAFALFNDINNWLRSTW